MNSALPSPQKLSALVAMTSEGVIGRDGDLPWHLPADLRFFKETTSGHAIVMGRQTYESIGRPLPKRQNIVLTRDRQFVAPGCELIHSPDKLAELPPFSDTTYIIGGAQIYRLFLPTLDELIIT
ncbi:MAG: dihydrofolate reductase, partial [Verrucomicrobiales bacterium]